MERSVTLFLPLQYVFHKYCESHDPSVIYTANSERYRWQTIDDKLKRICPRFLSICSVSREYSLTYALDTFNGPVACMSMDCLPSRFLGVGGKLGVGAWCRYSFQRFTYRGADKFLARPGKNYLGSISGTRSISTISRRELSSNFFYKARCRKKFTPL